MNKKIIHLVGHFPSVSETFIANQIIVSIQEGFSVTILADKLLSIKKSSQTEIFEEYELHKKTKVYSSNIPKNKLFKLLKAIFLLLIHIRHFRVFVRSLNQKKFKGKAKSLKLWYQAAFFLDYYKTDLFHAHFGVNGVLLADLKEIGAIKGRILVSFYGYDTFSTKQNRRKIENYYKRLFFQAYKIHTNSNYLFQNLKLLNVPENKLIINHVGVDQQIFKYKERVPTENFNFITVGRLIELKGHIYGLQLIKKLKEKGYKVHYNIIGDGEEMRSLVKKSIYLGIQENVTFYGIQNQSTILNLLYQNDLFLMLSITDNTGRAEGQGLVTAEAQASGIPAIGFNSGGVPETIIDKKTGFIVPEKNIDALFEKVEILINNQKLRLEFGRNAVNLINDNFNNTKQALKLTEIYINSNNL